jgi:hypothetical protein
MGRGEKGQGGKTCTAWVDRERKYQACPSSRAARKRLELQQVTRLGAALQSRRDRFNRSWFPAGLDLGDCPQVNFSLIGIPSVVSGNQPVSQDHSRYIRVISVIVRYHREPVSESNCRIQPLSIQQETQSSISRRRSFRCWRVQSRYSSNSLVSSAQPPNDRLIPSGTRA